MTKIYFVRHAKPVTEGEDRYRPLTEEGLADAALVLETLKDRKIDAVYCSPYRRSIQTVEALAEHFGKEIVIDERLHERVSGGKWNNRGELMRRWEDFEYHEREGESLGSVQRRNVAALKAIIAKHEGDAVVIGTHGTALSMIFNYFDPSFGIDDFFRIVKWMPYIVECDFEDGKMISKTEIAYIDKAESRYDVPKEPELWDAYDCDLNKIDGVTLVRGEPVPEGMYHLVSDVIVKHKDGEYLLMQRDPRKHYGGMWEATAGGSALAGESAYECACRELKEETGIYSHDLEQVGIDVSDETRTVYVEFFCETECEKDSVVMQEGETSAYKWVTREELLSMKKEELVTKRMQKFIEELKK